MRKVAMALLVALTVSLGALAAAADPPVGGPPGQGECEHGNSGQECKPDPQPEHGQECEEHGPNEGGVNEDHCLPTTTTTVTTVPSTTTAPPTTTTTTVTSPPTTTTAPPTTTTTETATTTTVPPVVSDAPPGTTDSPPVSSGPDDKSQPPRGGSPDSGIPSKLAQTGAVTDGLILGAIFLFVLGAAFLGFSYLQDRRNGAA